MTPIIISICALSLSIYVAYLQKKFYEDSTRRASRETHIRMVFEIGKTLVESPELWAVYDTHPLAAQKDMSPHEVARRQAFIYQHFNLFELARDYYVDLILRNDVDEGHWRAWNRYIRQFFRDSSEALQLFGEARTTEVYSSSFVAYARAAIKEIQSKQPVTISKA